MHNGPAVLFEIHIASLNEVYKQTFAFLVQSASLCSSMLLTHPVSEESCDNLKTTPFTL